MALLKKHFFWFRTRFAEDRVDSCAAHSSFFLLISSLPYLGLIFLFLRRLQFADGVDVIEGAFQYLPESIWRFIEGVLPTIPLDSSGLIPVTVIAALWASSAGMVTIIKGLDQIYRVKKRRNYAVNRLIALGYVVVLAVLILLTVTVLVFGSTLFKTLEGWLSPGLVALLKQFRSVLGFVVLWGYFSLAYTFLPRRRVKTKYNVLGAAVAALGWVVFSFLFSLFVENFSNFTLYGSLGTLVALMYWLFFCMVILFMGAEVAVWLETGLVQEDLRRWQEKKERTEGKLDEKNRDH